jgi:hypothetical protein
MLNKSKYFRNSQDEWYQIICRMQQIRQMQRRQERGEISILFAPALFCPVANGQSPGPTAEVFTTESTSCPNFSWKPDHRMTACFPKFI